MNAARGATKWLRGFLWNDKGIAIFTRQELVRSGIVDELLFFSIDAQMLADYHLRLINAHSSVGQMLFGTS